MNLDEILTSDFLFRWLEKQNWVWREWFKQGIESVSLKDLYNQSIVLASSLENYLRGHSYELNSYTYRFDPYWPADIIRTSPKIRKPEEPKMKYVFRKIGEKITQ